MEETLMTPADFQRMSLMTPFNRKKICPLMSLDRKKELIMVSLVDCIEVENADDVICKR